MARHRSLTRSFWTHSRTMDTILGTRWNYIVLWAHSTSLHCSPHASAESFIENYFILYTIFMYTSESILAGCHQCLLLWRAGATLPASGLVPAGACSICMYNMLCCVNIQMSYFLQFPGGSDNYLTISGGGHTFLSSSEVWLPFLHASQYYTHSSNAACRI